MIIDREITIKLAPREDGGLRVWSDDLPGLILSHSSQLSVLHDIGPAIGVLLGHGYPVSAKANLVLEYMRKHAPRRGGFMYEGARPAYEAGKYHDEELAELLAAGLIAPHPDPKKGWVVVNLQTSA